MSTPKPLLELEFRLIAAPAHASEGAVVYALLPSVAELLGVPGFARDNPILLTPDRIRFDPWTFFGRHRTSHQFH